MSTTVSKQLNKKELKRFHEMLVEKRRAVLERARKTLSEDMTLDPNDLPDEMDLASSEYIQSFEFRMRGREKFLLKKIDLALKKIDDGVFGVCEMLRGADRQEAARGAARDQPLHPLQGRPGARRAHLRLSPPGCDRAWGPSSLVREPRILSSADSPATRGGAAPGAAASLARAEAMRDR